MLPLKDGNVVGRSEAKENAENEEGRESSKSSVCQRLKERDIHGDDDLVN